MLIIYGPKNVKEKYLIAINEYTGLHCQTYVGMVSLGGWGSPPPMLGKNVASWSKIKKPLGQNWI